MPWRSRKPAAAAATSSRNAAAKALPSISRAARVTMSGSLRRFPQIGEQVGDFLVAGNPGERHPGARDELFRGVQILRQCRLVPDDTRVFHRGRIGEILDTARLAPEKPMQIRTGAVASTGLDRMADPAAVEHRLSGLDIRRDARR